MYEKNHLFWGGLLFYAFNVGAVLGVDANLVAGVAEKGHANGCAGFNGGGLEGVGSGVALDAGFGVGDFENYALGHFAGQNGFAGCVNHSFANVAVLEELNAFDAFAGHDDFFPGFGVEEVVAEFVFVGVLVGATFNADFFDLDAGVPGFVDYAAGANVFQLGANESGAFAGFNVEEFNDEEVLAVNVEAHTVLEVSSCCHRLG